MTDYEDLHTAITEACEMFDNANDDVWFNLAYVAAKALADIAESLAMIATELTTIDYILGKSDNPE